jgi:hypothetical protein
MVQFRLFSLVSLLLFSPIINAWHIDADCTGGKRAFVKRALANAFMLNTEAGAFLGSPQTANQYQIIEWLFGTDAGTRERLGRT